MELSKLLSPLVNAPKAIVETGCKFINSLLAEPLKVAGGILEDGFALWRWKNRLRIATKAKKILDENEIASKILPPDFLLPLLDAAGDISDESLQELWAKLLAAAVENESHQHPSFIRILSQLSPIDARVLVELRVNWDQGGTGIGTIVLSVENLAERAMMSKQQASSAVEALKAFGLCEDAATPPFPKPARGEFSTIVCLSNFGARLTDACMGEKHNEED